MDTTVYVGVTFALWACVRGITPRYWDSDSKKEVFIMKVAQSDFILT